MHRQEQERKREGELRGKAGGWEVERRAVTYQQEDRRGGGIVAEYVCGWEKEGGAKQGGGDKV